MMKDDSNFIPEVSVITTQEIIMTIDDLRKADVLIKKLSFQLVFYQLFAWFFGLAWVITVLWQ